MEKYSSDGDVLPAKEKIDAKILQFRDMSTHYTTLKIMHNSSTACFNRKASAITAYTLRILGQRLLL